jgi:YaiO family outer membrane protein
LLKKYLAVFLFIVIAPLISFAAEDISYDKAMQLKSEKNYAEAEKMFLELTKRDINNSEFWFELGLTQRFQQKESEALLSQEKALEISANNNDAKLEIARLYFWRGNRDQAKILLNEILTNKATNPEASELLARVIKAESAPEEKKYLWQLDVGHQYSHFSRVKQDSWTIDSLQIGRRINAKTVLNFRNENVKRFKQHDQYYEVGAVHNFSNRLSGNITLGRSPNADFYPRSRVGAGIEAKIIHKHNFLGDTWLTADGWYSRYQQVNISAFKPGVRYAILKDLTIHAQYINIIDENKKNLNGWAIRSDWQTPWLRLRVFAGLANAPETQNAVTINTKSRFAGIAYQLTPRLTAYLSHSRDDRENSFIRKTFDGTLSFKF